MFILLKRAVDNRVSIVVWNCCEICVQWITESYGIWEILLYRIAWVILFIALNMLRLEWIACGGGNNVQCIEIVENAASLGCEIV